MRTSTPSSTPGVAAGLGGDPLRRVHLYSLVLTALFGLLLVLRVDRGWAVGFVLAGLWSTANFWALEQLLRAAVRPTGRSPRRILLAGAVKIPILYALLFMLVVKGGYPPVSLVVGLSVPLLVTVLKILGRIAVSGASPSERAAPERADRT